MQPFIDHDFLLSTTTARKLFEAYAEKLPICDYHCHIDPQELAANQNYSDLSQVWLGGDHYKWRAMRLFGIPEAKITGQADPQEKFKAWAKVMPYLIGNPLHHWTHLELKRYFGIEEPLSEKTADRIWQTANDALARPDFRPIQLLEKLDVRWLCTTDDPLADLGAHKNLQAKVDSVRVLPAFRPDRFFKIDADSYEDLLRQLAAASQIPVQSFSDLVKALACRIDFFHEQGCRLSDHALDRLWGVSGDAAAANQILQSRLTGMTLSLSQTKLFQASLLKELAAHYDRLGWTMQLHIGAKRNASDRAFAAYGADSGFDVIADAPIADDLVTLLNDLESDGCLPKTLLYSLNGQDNLTLGTIAGAFARDGQPSHVGLGPAWWFHDQLDGMRLHLRQLCQVGVLSTFVGMTTDSRSLLSYTRHEYFRRIFCGQLGAWVEQGQYPDDEKVLKELIEKIGFYNAAALVDRN